MKARRPGSKGTEWLLIKKHDDDVVEGFDIDKYDTSVLSNKTMAQIAGDEGSAEWQSSKKASRGGPAKAVWLGDTLARVDKKKRSAADSAPKKASAVKKNSSGANEVADRQGDPSSEPELKNLHGAVKRPMPTAIHPMLASVTEKPFDDPNWFFEIKWDGYRAVAFIENGSVRLVSRNQNDLTPRYPELKVLASQVNAHNAILDGEVVVLDEQGRPSFSLMQQRTGIRAHGRQAAPNRELPILYYAFDLLYLDGYDLRRVTLEERKRVLQEVLKTGEVVRFSNHYPGQGIALFELAKQKGLEGILAKKRNSCYEERRTREWLKIKITQTVDCVIGGYTDPEGSRQYFGSLVLGLYDRKRN
jgi:bifunctional non-homologous end joining protein LigD